MNRVALVIFLVATVGACAEREKTESEPATVGSATNAVTPAPEKVDLGSLKVVPLKGKLKNADIPTKPPVPSSAPEAVDAK